MLISLCKKVYSRVSHCWARSINLRWPLRCSHSSSSSNLHIRWWCRSSKCMPMIISRISPKIVEQHINSRWAWCSINPSQASISKCSQCIRCNQCHQECNSYSGSWGLWQPMIAIYSATLKSAGMWALIDVDGATIAALRIVKEAANNAFVKSISTEWQSQRIMRTVKLLAVSFVLQYWIKTTKPIRSVALSLLCSFLEPLCAVSSFQISWSDFQWLLKKAISKNSLTKASLNPI